MSLTDKIIAVLAVVVGVLALNAVVILRIMSDAKSHEDAAVLKVSAAAEIGAQKITDNWKSQYDQADATHKQELADAIQFVPTPSVSKYTLSTIVSASSTATGSVSTTPAASPKCDGILQPASDELQWEFDNAVRSDQVIADYRNYYSSWPQSTLNSARSLAPSK